MNTKYEAVIGLEIHIQLNTATKAFCSCSTDYTLEPNVNVCPVCLGHPGVLPVLNERVIEDAILLGMALNCRINHESVFARKSYFYPDLPKGYQISQYDKPVCAEGWLNVKDFNKEIRQIGITRIHIEEDAGKLMHQGNSTRLDANRCGIPLLEIVTEPDLRTPSEASGFLSKIRQIVRYLNICNGNMEEGSLRCDANISLRKPGEQELGTKTELKNMNSFRNVEKALQYEIDRQTVLLDDGESIVQETLLWDAELNEAYSMRTKEDAHDYRYFPEPDLKPLIINDDLINKVKTNLPELPDEKFNRFATYYNLPEYDSSLLTADRHIADYFEKTTIFCKDYKAVSNWIMGDVMKLLNENKINILDVKIQPNNLAELINLIDNNIISSKIAKEVFQLMIPGDKTPMEIITEKKLMQISDTAELELIVEAILDNSQNEVAEYLSGKEKVIGFFVGKAMKETKGKANPQVINNIIKTKLELRK